MSFHTDRYCKISKSNPWVYDLVMFNIFSCVSYLCILFGEVSVQVFCLFSKWTVLLVLSLQCSFLLQIQVFCQMTYKYVLPFYDEYLYSIRTIHETKVKFWSSLIYWFFLLRIVLLVSGLKILHLIHSKYFLLLCSKNFIVLHLDLWIHLELIFV